MNATTTTTTEQREMLVTRLKLLNSRLRGTPLRLGHLLAIAYDRDGRIEAYVRNNVAAKVHNAVRRGYHANVAPAIAVKRLLDENAGRLCDAYEGPLPPAEIDGDYRCQLDALRWMINLVIEGTGGIQLRDLLHLRLTGNTIEGKADDAAVEAMFNLARQGNLGRIS